MKKIFNLLLFTFLIFSCTEDKSGNTELKDFIVTNISNDNLEISETKIKNTTQSIYLYFNNDLREIEFPISLTISTELSKNARTSFDNTDQITFNSPDQVNNFEVIAENGNTSEWLVFLVHKQIQNSDFETWFTTQGLNGYPYEEVGKSIDKSVWATANLGTSTYSVYGSKPITIDNNTVVQIKTDSTQTLPITAGTLFTGYFYLNGAISNPDNPKKATLFGTPFTQKPTAFKVKYKYKAGDWYKQATLIKPDNIFGGFSQEGIEGEDMCAIYAILENKTDDVTTEIARGELYSGSTTDQLTETLIPFEYRSQLTPTHITIVFSSSKDGDLWRGAVGSTLTIDDLELIYL